VKFKGKGTIILDIPHDSSENKLVIPDEEVIEAGEGETVKRVTVNRSRHIDLMQGGFDLEEFTSFNSELFKLFTGEKIAVNSDIKITRVSLFTCRAHQVAYHIAVIQGHILSQPHEST